MSTKRIQFNNVVQNQLPGYVRTDYPLVAEFLKSYYQGQEYQGGPIDLVQNIDQYTKVNEQVGLTEYVGLGASIGIVNDLKLLVQMSIIKEILYKTLVLFF